MSDLWHAMTDPLWGWLTNVLAIYLITCLGLILANGLVQISFKKDGEEDA